MLLSFVHCRSTMRHNLWSGLQHGSSFLTFLFTQALLKSFLQSGDSGWAEGRKGGLEDARLEGWVEEFIFAARDRLWPQFLPWPLQPQVINPSFSKIHSIFIFIHCYFHVSTIFFFYVPTILTDYHPAQRSFFCYQFSYLKLITYS